MSEELKSCPFCGGESFYIKIMGNYEKPHEIFCSKCDGAITEGRSEKQVVTNWNARPIEDALQSRIAELSQAVGLITTLKPTMVMDVEHPLDMAKEVAEYVTARIAELETAQRWIPVSERLPDGGHRAFYEVACIYQDFGELALFSKGRWVIYEGENVYDVTKRVKFWRKRQYLPDEVIAILSKGKTNPEVQE